MKEKMKACQEMKEVLNSVQTAHICVMTNRYDSMKAEAESKGLTVVFSYEHKDFKGAALTGQVFKILEIARKRGLDLRWEK